MAFRPEAPERSFDRPLPIESRGLPGRDLYEPLGILTFQNNGVFSGQEVPHYHFHVVPRQPGSDWGIGPPQLAVFDGAGRVRGTAHDASDDEERRKRVQVDVAVLQDIARTVRACLPD